MTFLSSCSQAAIGVESIQCLNAAASYALGWVLIVMVAMVMWNKIGIENNKDKFASITFFLAILSMLMIASGFLPETAFVYFFFAAIGSVAALMFRR